MCVFWTETVMSTTKGNEEDEDCFADAREEVSSVSDCNSEAADEFVQASDDLDLWTTNPESVTNRRQKFFQSMGFSFKKRDFDLDLDLLQDSVSDHNIPVSEHLNSVSETDHEEDDDDDEEEEEKLLSNESISSGSSVSSFSTSSLAEAFSFRGSFQNRVKNIDDQILLTRDCSSNSNSIAEGLSESGSCRSDSYGDFQNSPLSRYEESPKKVGAKGWLKKLGVLTHVLDKNQECNDGESVGSSIRRQLTRVQSFKKQFKELSSLCIGQEFSAHDGSIVVMKFSHDGKYLASAGEDCVVRVWNITEDERRDNEFEVAESDSSSDCVYFGMNDKSQIEPLKTENEKMEKSRRLLRKKSESTCAVLPSRVFSISETSQHEFRGHKGEILDLSWSQKGVNYLK